MMINKIKSFLNKGHQRTILAKKNIIISFFITFFQMLISFAMVSISIKYLGEETYGIWLVISGIIVWSNIFDLGFSNGLRNRLAETRASGDMADAKYYVSTTYAFLIAITILLSILFVPFIYAINWQSLLNTTVIENLIIRNALVIIFTGFLIQFILKPIGSILQAFQWPSMVQFLSLLGSLLAFLGVIYVLYYYKSSLTLYSYIIACTPVIIMLIATIYLYRTKFSSLFPSIKYVKIKYFKSIAGLGSSFFIIQLCAVIIFQTDNMIISYILGPKEVTNYNIVFRYFSIITIGFGVVMSPFWTAFTDAYKKNDFTWIKKTVKILFLILIASGFASLVLLLFSDDIYKLWINDSISIPKSLSALMVAYVIVYGFLKIFSFFLNGTGKVKLQMVVYIIASLGNIPLSLFFGKVLGFGVNGVLLSTILCALFVGIVLYIQYIKLIKKSAKGIWNA